MRDRLPDLQARIKPKNNESRKDSMRCSFVDSDVLSEVCELRQSVTDLESMVDEVETVHKDILAAPQQDPTGMTFSDDKIEELLERKEPGIFTHAIMADTEAAKRSLSDIEARHADIMRLQKSIEEMHELFLNISLLVEQQGDLVDRIETNISKTVDYTGQSKAKLADAVRRQKKGRRRKIICIIVLSVLGLLVLIAIASAIGLT